MITDNWINPQDLRKRRIKLGIPLSVLGEYMGFSGAFLSKLEGGKSNRVNRLRTYKLVLEQLEAGKVTLRTSRKVSFYAEGNPPAVPAKCAKACMFMRHALNIPTADAAELLGCHEFEVIRMEQGESPMTYAQLALLLKMMSREAQEQCGDSQLTL